MRERPFDHVDSAPGAADPAPASRRASRSRAGTPAPSAREADARRPAAIEDTPRRAVTVGVAPAAAAPPGSGRGEAPAARAAIEGPPSAPRRRAGVAPDKAAASRPEPRARHDGAHLGGGDAPL